MRLLVGFEESGRVTDAFIRAGVDAWSCDLLSTSGTRPDRHFQADFFQVYEAGCYDALICFPPCTFLTRACTGNYKDPRRLPDSEAALDLVERLFNLPVEFLCIENPPGKISSRICPPSQVIQPYYYGDMFSKTTCLWLRGFPPLPIGDYIKAPSWVFFKDRDPCRRSKTFPGVATTMAREWAPVLLGERKYQGSLFFQ